MGCDYSSAQWEMYIIIKHLLFKKERFQVNNLSFHLKLEKEEQNKCRQTEKRN